MFCWCFYKSRNLHTQTSPKIKVFRMSTWKKLLVGISTIILFPVSAATASTMPSIKIHFHSLADDAQPNSLGMIPLIILCSYSYRG